MAIKNLNISKTCNGRRVCRLSLSTVFLLIISNSPASPMEILSDIKHQQQQLFVSKIEATSSGSRGDFSAVLYVRDREYDLRKLNVQNGELLERAQLVRDSIHLWRPSDNLLTYYSFSTDAEEWEDHPYVKYNWIHLANYSIPIISGLQSFAPDPLPWYDVIIEEVKSGNYQEDDIAVTNHADGTMTVSAPGTRFGSYEVTLDPSKNYVMIRGNVTREIGDLIIGVETPSRYQVEYETNELMSLANGFVFPSEISALTSIGGEQGVPTKSRSLVHYTSVEVNPNFASEGAFTITSQIPDDTIAWKTNEPEGTSIRPSYSDTALLWLDGKVSDIVGTPTCKP